ncbi:apolipoprotein N-acyltransferase [Aliikangiella sp. G2MR2-5]|uniref:apolipoprotein N-acyltransferase n=1 Tax=Aliikangiella sp. G2MR2-5 TaxID=2788943 RepID=UPI0018ABC6BF|nr:apolipoprotein N-acyltransferase [Aliikangiella sp. G2MR2-5]
MLHFKKLSLALLSSFALILAYVYEPLGWLGFVALVPIIYATEKAKTKVDILCWIICIFVYAAVVYFRMPQMLLEKATSSAWIAYPSTFLFILWQTLPFMVFALCRFKIKIMGEGANVFLLAATLTLLSFFHWSPLPLIISSQLEIPVLFLQVLDIGGLPLADFLIYVVNFSFAKLLFALKDDKKQQLRKHIVTISAVLSTLIIYGLFSIYRFGTNEEQNSQNSISVGLVHTSFAYNVSKKAELNKLLELTRSLKSAQQNINLIVWPELPNPPRQRADINLKRVISQLNKEFNSPVLTHNLAFSDKHSGFNNQPYRYNLVSLFDAEKIVAEHKKQLLLPLVEYLPMENLLRDVFPKPASYIPGEGSSVLTLANGVMIAPLICYESDFPDYSMQAVNLGANLLINVVNDTWSQNHLNARKHFRLAQMRAIELRKSIIRVTNNGYSGVVYSSGKGQRIYAPGEYSSQLKSVPLSEHRSLYFYLGDWVFWGCLLIIVWQFLRYRYF